VPLRYRGAAKNWQLYAQLDDGTVPGNGSMLCAPRFQAIVLSVGGVRT